MGKILGELESLKSDIQTYQGINLSLVEELRAANCPELAEQKMLLQSAESTLIQRLEQLKSGWHFDDAPSPWS